MIRRRHLVSTLAFGVIGLAAAGCGGSDHTPGATTLGTQNHPLVATMPPADKVSADKATGARQRAAGHHVKATTRINEASAPTGSSSETSTSPSYTGILKNQSKHPRTRFSPCNLVTQRQAQGIFGALAQEPVEAPQGPTCIYRTQTGKSFVTLAVQSMPFKPLLRHLRGRHTVGVSGRTGYCGSLGQPMVYVPLSNGRLLTVGAPCSTGRAFATRAIAQLKD